jgi:hypothetical protein
VCRGGEVHSRVPPALPEAGGEGGILMVNDQESSPNKKQERGKNKYSGP